MSFNCFVCCSVLEKIYNYHIKMIFMITQERIVRSVVEQEYVFISKLNETAIVVSNIAKLLSDYDVPPVH